MLVLYKILEEPTHTFIWSWPMLDGISLILKLSEVIFGGVISN